MSQDVRFARVPASEPRWLVDHSGCLVRRPQRVQPEVAAVDDAVGDRRIHHLRLVARGSCAVTTVVGLSPGLRLWPAGRRVGSGSTGDQQY
jgi:hypothetical protein